MRPTRSAPALSVLSAIALSTVVAAVRAHGAAASSVWDGVYSDVQARRGLDVYKQRCETCHLESLEGSGNVASLIGNDFMGDWTGRSVGDLVRRTMSTMPADDPGTLTPQQTVDAVAYILSRNRFPAGSSDLPTDADALKQIRVGPKE